MIYRSQSDFYDFSCIADRCPMNCCSGWQIVIDKKSLDKYRSWNGEFEDRLRSGIDYKESCFRQTDGRCSMLSDSGLCDLQSSLGEDFLCDTCMQYPRHTEEFPDLREYSLSLSCPEAVRMLFASDSHLTFRESEDGKTDDYDDYEDFDFFLFDRLCYARERMLDLSSGSLPLQEKMDLIASYAFRLQGLFDNGDISDMDQLSCTAALPPRNGRRSGFAFSYGYMCESLGLLDRLEILEPSWSDTLRATTEYWRAHKASSAEWQQAMYPDRAVSFICEKMLESLLFTYFCGSIYDGQIYARAMIAVMTVRWIMMISAASSLTPEETVYLFSREVEHSDLNLNALISWFEEELD